MEVLVHKASIDLLKNESVHDFTRNVNEAGKAYLIKIGKITEKRYAYATEIFAKNVIFDICDLDKGTTYYAVEYARKNGEFEFKNPTKVKRRTVFEPDASQLKLTKAKGVMVSKPFPNEHAARQTQPKGYNSYARIHPKGFPIGVDAIIGIKTVGGKDVSEIQSIRFDAKKWTVKQAKAWLEEHEFKISGFEQSAKKIDGDWISAEKGVWSNII